jgi:protein gp37
MPRYLNNVKKTIGWCDYTWNPVTGCLHGCPYCYAASMARRFGKSFEPEFHPERLSAPGKLDTPSRIFVGSVTDMCGDFIKQEWLNATCEAMAEASHHHYLFLTKKPYSRYFREVGVYNLKRGRILWYGATITKMDDLQVFHCPSRGGCIKPDYVSIEPLLEEISPEMLAPLQPKWIIIGARTPYNKSYHPKREWVEKILEFARKHKIPTYLKDNLRWHDPSMGSGQAIKEFPMALNLQPAGKGGK